MSIAPAMMILGSPMHSDCAGISRISTVWRTSLIQFEVLYYFGRGQLPPAKQRAVLSHAKGLLKD